MRFVRSSDIFVILIDISQSLDVLFFKTTINNSLNMKFKKLKCTSLAERTEPIAHLLINS